MRGFEIGRPSYEARRLPQEPHELSERNIRHFTQASEAAHALHSQEGSVTKSIGEWRLFPKEPYSRSVIRFISAKNPHTPVSVSASSGLPDVRTSERFAIELGTYTPVGFEEWGLVTTAGDNTVKSRWGLMQDVFEHDNPYAAGSDYGVQRNRELSFILSSNYYGRYFTKRAEAERNGSDRTDSTDLIAFLTMTDKWTGQNWRDLRPPGASIDPVTLLSDVVSHTSVQRIDTTSDWIEDGTRNIVESVTDPDGNPLEVSLTRSSLIDLNLVYAKGASIVPAKEIKKWSYYQNADSFHYHIFMISPDWFQGTSLGLQRKFRLINREANANIHDELYETLPPAEPEEAQAGIAALQALILPPPQNVFQLRK